MIKDVKRFLIAWRKNQNTKGRAKDPDYLLIGSETDRSSEQ